MAKISYINITHEVCDECRPFAFMLSEASLSNNKVVHKNSHRKCVCKLLYYCCGCDVQQLINDYLKLLQYYCCGSDGRQL